MASTVHCVFGVKTEGTQEPVKRYWLIVEWSNSGLMLFFPDIEFQGEDPYVVRSTIRFWITSEESTGANETAAYNGESLDLIWYLLSTYQMLNVKLNPLLPDRQLSLLQQSLPIYAPYKCTYTYTYIVHWRQLKQVEWKLPGERPAVFSIYPLVWWQITQRLQVGIARSFAIHSLLRIECVMDKAIRCMKSEIQRFAMCCWMLHSSRRQTFYVSSFSKFRVQFFQEIGNVRLTITDPPNPKGICLETESQI